MNEEEAMSISVKTNFDQVYKELGQMQKAPEKVIKRTIADFKRRAVVDRAGSCKRIQHKKKRDNAGQRWKRQRTGWEHQHAGGNAGQCSTGI